MSPRPALVLSAIFALLASSNTFAQRTGASSNSVSQDSAKTATVSFNQTTALTTDREVYPPEALVNIYGSGYLPGEPVSLTIKYQDSLFNEAGPDFSVSAVADTSGQFEVSWTIPADGGISDTLILQGLGALSGRMAGTVVHTANTILTLTILASDTLCPAGTVGAPDSFVVRANLAQFCSKEVTANLAGREILFFLNPGDCGVEIAQMSQDSALTDADGNAFVTFATPSVQGKYSVRAKFREEARPKPCPGTGNSACITEPGNSKRCMKLSKSNDCLRFVVMQDACPRPPKLVCPPNELITLCGPAEVCISPLTVDSRAGSAVTISLSFGELRGDSICFLADTAGVYVITAIAMDSDGNADTCQSVITVKFNSPPDIIGGGRTFNACFPGALINHDVNAVDLDGDTLIWSLSSGFGAINQSGLITFTADTSGTYCFTVRVDDICGFTEDVICLTVLLDQLPRINEFIDTVRACPGDSLCVTVTGSDPDIGDQLDIVQLGGPGVFLMNTDTSGVTCFQVGEITGPVTYTFTYRITDNCLRDSSTAATPRPPIGTVTVTVIPPRPLTVTLPADFTSSQCAPEQICVDVSITDPDHNLVAVNTNFGIYNPDAGTVCYTPIGSGVDTLIVATVDSCGGVALDSVVITVVTAPTVAVTCPADTSIFICDSGLVCVPFGIFPAGVTVNLRPASASYNPVTGDICFFTNCSVRKQLTVIVDNGCAADTCNFVVDVTLNSSPFVITRPQLEIDLCQPGTVCWPAGIIDVDDNIRSIVVTPAGTYNSITGKICVPVDSSVLYRVIVTVADSCGAEGVDTTFLNAHVNSPPEINGGSDLALLLCAPQEVCVQFIAGDIDGAPPLVTTNIGVYNGISNIICFVPDTAGVYAIIGTATDSCGATDADTVIVTVSFNQPPLVILGADTTITLCNLSQLCLPVTFPAVPGNDNLQSVIPNTGFYNPITREICFTPGAAGVNEIILTATDACGVQSADTILITIIVNDTARISCPAGPVAIDVCGQDSVFYPLEITPSNARVAVQGANYSGGILSFAADTSGTYLIHVSAASDCGADSCDIVFNVRVGVQISLNCPVDTSVFICNSGQTIFIPVGLMVDSSAVTVTPIGSYRNGSIGFSADTAGIYSITVLVDNACGTASCSFTVNTAINSAPSVQVAGKAVSLCSAGEIALPISVADPDGNIRSVSSSIGTIDGDTLRFTPPGAGEFTALVTVVDSCGLSAVDTALITVAINTGPAVDLGPDTAFALCAVDSICLPVTFTDADNNIDISSVTVSGGTFAAGRVCFLPTGSGLHTIILSVSDSCGAAARDTVVIDVDINAAPVVTLAGPGDTSLCAPASICLAGTVSDNNLQSVTSVGGAFVNGSICFTPDTSGAYTFVLSATDSCGVTVSDTEIVNVFLNLPPVVAGPQDTLVTVCDAGTICFALDATDPDDNILSIIASGARNALYSNGTVCFDPDSSGVYAIVILATDSCGQTGSDTVNVTVITNSAPRASFASDSLVVQCVTDSVCIPVAISDTDGNIAAVTVLGGSFNEQTGNVCFLPTTSGVFVISLSVIDSCGLSAADSLFVSVNLGEVVTLVCPSDTALFICEPDTLCFPISGVPAGAEIVVSPNSGWYDEASRQICFYTNCSVVKNLSIVVTNGCFVDSCAFVVNVTMNSPPLVIAAPDTGAVLCGLQDVCLPVGISDADDNLSQVIVEPFGSYNPITGLACIPIDSSGLYLITITAIDSCGARGVDSVIINAAVNRAPNVSFGADSALFLCRPQEICIPVSVGDPDNNIFMVANSLGVYDNLAGAVCFTPGDSSAVYRLIVTAVDSCGLVNADTVFVAVSINSAPTLTLAADTSVFLCKVGEVCIPVSVMDIDGNFLGITTSPGASYDELTGEVCFIAAASVVIPITVTALDSCGAFVSKTINIDVTINSPPRVVAAADTVVSGCGISEVCFPVGISDADDNIAGVSVLPFGSYNPISGLVCLTPADTGAIAVIISVVDSCGLIGADTTMVVVTIGPDVSIECPLVPFNVSLCGPDTVRQMITVNPPDAQVTTTFGEYANGQLVFFADTAGTYQISLIAQGGCGVDTCLLTFVVIQGQVPKFNCPADTSIFLCAPAEICRPVGVLPDGANVTILPAGRYQAGMVCFDADTTGRYVITALAQTACGNDSCTFTVDVTINSAPFVTSLADTSALMCDLPGVQICRFAPVSDVNGNLLKVNVPAFATYDASGQICFTPDTAGTYRLFVEAVDSCGVRVADTFLVEILSVAPALIICPDTVAFEFCFDITQRFGLDITPAEAIVSATGGTLLGADSIGLFFDTSGVYTSQIIAATDCGADTCEFVVKAVRLPLPTITCPADQNLFLCAPDTLCLPFSFSPPPAFVSVSAPAFISGDSVCIPLLNDTTLTVTLTSAVSCAQSSCSFTVTAEVNEAPVVTLGPDFSVLQCGVDSVCIPVSISDDENNVKS
ncbi:MAG: hypothetical protein IH914_01235, partial [candidate division Zixibacteria bacterium]|nr:hypothetical protein [candidate division Zixibacteria bacterium]